MRRQASLSELRVYAGILAGLMLLAGCGKEDSRRADAQPLVQQTDHSAAFLDMAQRHASAMLIDSPELATSLGVPESIAGAGYNARLGDYGFEGMQRARELNEKFLQELKSVERRSLSGVAATTYDVLRNAYEIGARRNQFFFGGAVALGFAPPYVVTQLSGPHLFLPRLLQTQHPIGSKGDIEAYLARLGEFGRVFDEVVESLGADAALGVTPPYFALEGARQSIASLTAPPPSEHPLVMTLATKVQEVRGLTEGERAEYAARAALLVEAVVYPAYQRLAAALDGLVAQAGRDAGVWRLGEEGAAFYQLALSAYGADQMTADEVHEQGHREVARISERMDEILRSQGLVDGSVAERLGMIAARPDMIYANTIDGRAALLDDLRGQVASVLEAAPRWFGTLPKQSIEVRRIPIYEETSAPGGYYTGPSLDGARPGIYWINLKDTQDWPKFTLKTLTFHEAVPGHHFQISLQRAIDDLPLIRNMLGYSEFTEGWALYAEALAEEMGMYADDPLGDLGRLQSELFRAARLVVDTGLHYKQWTREEAIEYMVNVTGESRSSIIREVERYAVWPGQAASYKLGMMKMAALRARAERELGAEFDIRDFHDQVLLAGAVPLPVLEQRIGQWIEDRRVTSAR